MFGGIDFEEGWEVLKVGIESAMKILEGDAGKMCADDYLKYYTTVYSICITSNIDRSRELYERYKLILRERVDSVVMPSLMDKEGDFLLQELVAMWSNYKRMTKRITGFFGYLDRYYVICHLKPPLGIVSVRCFFEPVWQMLHGKIRVAVISLIGRDREGEKIDVDLLKSVMSLISDAEEAIPYLYSMKFEPAIIEDARAYYTRKASELISENSNDNYDSKIDEFVEEERKRLSCYYLNLCKESRRASICPVMNARLAS